MFNTLDFLAANWLLPVGGLLIAVFAGWVMCRNSTAEELGGAGFMYRVWRVLARYVVPVGILFVFLKAVGLLPDMS
jgi:NSS family neurotransmitter:Na+ symporter